MQEKADALRRTVNSAFDEFCEQSKLKPADTNILDSLYEHYEALQNELAAKEKQVLELEAALYQNKAALQAASTYYIYSFATAYSAYLHAVSIAARYHPSQQHDVFCKTVELQLTKSFMCEPLEPGFLMQVLTSDITQKAVIILLLTSFVSLAIAGAALVNPVISAAIVANVGVSETVVAGVGAGAMAASAALYGMRFFAERRFHKDNEKSREAVANAIDFDGKMQMATPLSH